MRPKTSCSSGLAVRAAISRPPGRDRVFLCMLCDERKAKCPEQHRSTDTVIIRKGKRGVISSIINDYVRE